jgi:hypothetical protein
MPNRVDAAEQPDRNYPRGKHPPPLVAAEAWPRRTALALTLLIVMGAIALSILINPMAGLVVGAAVRAPLRPFRVSSPERPLGNEPLA